MVQLTKVQIDQDIDLEDFAVLLGMSRSTLGKIMTAERRGTKHQMSPRMAKRVTKSLCVILNQEVDIKDLEGVSIAAPRTGRPRKAS